MTDSAALEKRVLGALQRNPALLDSPRFHTTLDMTSKMNAREMAAQARSDSVNAHYAQIEAQREAAAQRSADTRLGIQERADAQRREDSLKLYLGKLHDEATRMGIKLHADIFGIREDQRLEKINQPVADLINTVDQAIEHIKANPGVTGLRGGFSRGMEFVQTSLPGGKDATPANDLQSLYRQIQGNYRKLPSSVGNRLKADALTIDSTIKGMGAFSNDTIALNSLTQLRGILARGLEARGGDAGGGGGGGAGNGAGGGATGPQKGDKNKSKSGKPMTFDGEKWVYD